MAEFVANFNLNNNNLDASFDLSESVSFDALFEIYAGSVTWGNILGDITNQTDLQNALSGLSDDIGDLSTTVTNNYNELNSSIDSNHQAILNINNTIQSYGDIVSYDAADFATSAQGALADTALQPNDNISELTNDVGYITSASFPVVNNNRITIQKNGSPVGDFTLNQASDEAININVPTTAAEVGALPDTTTINDLTTTAQQEALNSGANTTNIGQISANAQAIQTETTNRTNADNNLQSQIDALVVSSDVFDIVGTYAELQAYDISTVPVNDIIKVLVDSTHNNAATYYRCVENNDVKSWNYIGSEGAYYTKGEADSTFVPQTRTVNDKALSSNIILDASDVGALPDSTVIPTVNNATLTIQKNGANVQTFTANASSDVTANITVPTDTNDLTNGAGFITAASLPTVNNGTLTIQANGTTVGTFTANQSGNTTANIVVPDSATWGNITGTLSNQTDLQNALNSKADSSSIGNGTVTFTQGGVQKGSITMNQIGNTTITLDQGGTVDQVFDGESANAQSGIAIQGALDEKQGTLVAGDNISISTPVDIRVPEGYTQVVSLYSNTNAYIDTGLTGEMEWEIEAMGYSPYPAKRILIGTSTTGTTWFGMNGNSFWGGEGGITSISYATRTTIILNFTSSGCSGTVNGEAYSYTAGGDFNNHWMLGGVGSYNYYGYIYSAKARQNNAVIFDAVPAIRDSDNIAGFYDVVSDTFFPSIGTSVFTAGNVASSNYVVSAGVGNGTLTITQYGTQKAIFTANQSGNTSANVSPTVQPKETNLSPLVNSNTAKTANSLLFCGTDNLIHSYTETTQPISLAYGMFVNTSQISASSSATWYYKAEKCSWTVPSSLRSFTAKQKVYARCTYPNSSGQVFFVDLIGQANTVNTLAGGYTYYYLGVASSTTLLALNVSGSHFLSIDTNGNLTHIDGVEIAQPESGSSYWENGGTGLALAIASNDNSPVVDILYNNNYIAITEEGGIYTSTDGATWNYDHAMMSSEQLDGYFWKNICYGNGVYLAMNQAGYYSTSTDLSTLGGTITTPTASTSWVSIAFGKGKFVALRNNGYIKTSTDGTTWTTVTQVTNLGNNNWQSIVFGGNKFVALSDTGYYSTSTDGTTWTVATQNNNLGANSWRDLSYNGGQYLAVSDTGYYSTSTDGTTWTVAAQFWNTTTVDAVTYANNKFLAVTEGGALRWFVLGEKDLFYTKADTDLTNLTDSAKVLMSGMGMPSQTGTDLSIGASGSTYTAPADGYFYIHGDSSNNSNYHAITIFYNNTNNWNTPVVRICNTSPNAGMADIIPVKKGQEIRIEYAGVTMYNIQFVYAEGSESEAS